MSYDNIIQEDYTIGYYSGSVGQNTTLLSPFVPSEGWLKVNTSSSISSLKNKKFKFKNTNNDQKIYIFLSDPSYTTGDLESGEVVINLDGLSNDNDVASEIEKAIKHPNGHNGTILTSIAGGTPDTINLTQATGGVDGNRTITLLSGLGSLMSKSDFTGGANSTYSAAKFMPYRFSLRTHQNIRFQSIDKYYKTFIGDQKS